jgi:hypothetical protein
MPPKPSTRPLGTQLSSLSQPENPTRPQTHEPHNVWQNVENWLKWKRLCPHLCSPHLRDTHMPQPFKQQCTSHQAQLRNSTTRVFLKSTPDDSLKFRRCAWQSAGPATLTRRAPSGARCQEVGNPRGAGASLPPQGGLREKPCPPSVRLCGARLRRASAVCASGRSA